MDRDKIEKHTIRVHQCNLEQFAKLNTGLNMDGTLIVNKQIATQAIYGVDRLH